MAQAMPDTLHKDKEPRSSSINRNDNRKGDSNNNVENDKHD